MKTTILLLTVLIIFFVDSSFAQQPGTLDSSFGRNGKVTINPTGFSSDVAYSVSIQTDGKIVASGTGKSTCCDGETYSNYVTVRYNKNGDLDTDFAVKGVANTDFHGYDYSDDFGYAVAIQADGKIIAAGTAWNDTRIYNFGMARYKLNGDLDSSFGRKGEVQTDIGNDSVFTNDYGRAITIQPDGKILIAGSVYISQGHRIAVVRYTPASGKVDRTFGINGRAVSSFTDDCLGTSVALQQDGKIIVAGTDVTKSIFVVARFTKNGKPDSSFGLYGIVTTKLNKRTPGVTRVAVAVQADGKIIAAGTASNGLNYDFAMVRYNENGKRDSSFGIDGKVITDLGSRDVGGSVAIQANGKIIMAGSSYNNDGNTDFALVRYNQNGKPDKKFGTNGVVLTDFSGKDNSGESVAIQADGKIVVAGYSSGAFAIARYNGDNTTVEKSNIETNYSNLQKQNNISSEIYLSPNPVKDLLHIQNMPSSVKNISVVDAFGRSVLKVTPSNNSSVLTVKQLPAGIYFIKIDETEKITTLKFIKE